MAKPSLVVTDEDRRMTIIEHLEELRRVLIVSIIAFAVGSIIGLTFSNQMLHILLIPLREAVGNVKTIAPGPLDKIFILFKIGLVTGLVISSPVIFWQIWSFIAPGLRRNERRFAVGFVASATILFAMGIGFAFFAMPIALRFLNGIASSDIIYQPFANNYISFMLIVIAIFGITFELPLALTMLGLAGIVTPQGLSRRRIPIWIGIFVGANLVTPGVDPFTPLLLTFPLIILFEISLIVIRILRR
jgi:sec-independent protein translocase protein TatC